MTKEELLKLANGSTLEQLREKQQNFANRRQFTDFRTPDEIEKAVSYIEKLAQPKPEIQTEFTSHEYGKTAYHFWGQLQKAGFRITEANKPIVQDLCTWLSGLKMVDEKDNTKVIIDPMKGIFLCGGTGNGKTTLMKCLQRVAYNENEYRFRNFKMKQMSELIGEMSKGYIPIVNDFKGSWCFDDIGVNYFEVAKVYGNSFHPLPFLIDLMYLNFKSGNPVHVTSNLTPKEILYSKFAGERKDWEFKEGFDERTRSRIFEMFNVIINTDIDHRFD